MAKKKKQAAKKAAPKSKAPVKAKGKAPKKSAAKAAPKKAASKAKPSKGAAKKVAMKAAKPAGKSAGKFAGKSAPKAPAKAASPKAQASKASAPTKFRVGQPLESLFTPLDDRLIVEKAGEATRTPGGLFIPDTVGATDRPKQGTVVAVGRGHRDKKGRIRPLDVKLGDTVMFEAYLGSELKIGDRELVVLRESQVLGIVK